MNSRLLVALLTLLSISSFSQVTRNGCTSQPVTIVVLGSSTAAGAGASPSDSAWVNRYRAGLQQINPSNQVINLGVGGFTTYRIMPDNFVTPTNRPAVDTTKNITMALSLNPDAIIVNLPSNDRGWPASEQLSNFDSLYRHSWNSGVPLYVCTTQPITTSGAYQSAVKDSILAMFGPHAINVFAPLTDTNNLIQPQFAADAVHLNNLGHRTLFNTVWNKDLLKDVVSPVSGVDLGIVKTESIAGGSCPDYTEVSMLLANFGDTTAYGIIHSAWIAGIDSLYQPLSSIVASCQMTAYTLSFTNVPPGKHNVIFHVQTQGDVNISNNYDTLSITVAGYGSSGFLDSNYYCSGDTLNLPAHNADGDSLLWYSSGSSTPLAYSSIQLLGVQSFEYKTFGAPYQYVETLSASNAPNITWDGNMFNIIADTTLTIHELRFVSGSAGNSYPLIHITNGSYLGRESNQSLWTLASADTISNVAVDDSITMNLNLSMTKGDTIGVYIHFGDASHRLRYQGGSSTRYYSDNQLTIQAGSGISHNFGGTYANRAISASIEYQWGFDSIGRCNYPRRSIHFIPARYQLGLPDTLDIFSGSATMSIYSSFTNVRWTDWITGNLLSDSTTVYIDSTTLGGSVVGWVIVSAIDSSGCAVSDTVVVDFHFQSLLEQDSGYSIFPNPSHGDITVEGLKEEVDFRVYSLSGNLLHIGKLDPNHNRIEIRELPAGVYVLYIEREERTSSFRIILTE